MRKTIAKAVTWRLIGTSEIFAISFWTTGHIETAGHTAVIAALASFLSYIVHELVWNGSISRDRVVECGEAIVIRIIGFSTQIIDLITLEVDPPSRLLMKRLPNLRQIASQQSRAALPCLCHQASIQPRRQRASDHPRGSEGGREDATRHCSRT
jgi:uncharacterized membrane protein